MLPLCALVHIDCLVTADAPNALICIGQQLATLSSNAGRATLDLLVFPGLVANGDSAQPAPVRFRT
jgi:hypothetical protein